MKTYKPGLTIVLTGVILTGCAEMRKPNEPPKVYPAPDLIAMAEKNSATLVRFRSKGGHLTAKMPTDGKTKRYDLDGVTVLYDQPRNMYLAGSYLGQPALQIGSNPENYWMGVLHDPSQLRWGYWKYADAECNPWRMGGPLKLLEGLGQIKLQGGGNLLAPTLSTRQDANVLTYRSAAGSPYTAKEVYLSRYEPIVVTKIVYYNPDGSTQVIMNFSKHRQVDGGGTMAHTIELTWPAKNGFMKLSLGKITPVATLPENAFKMPAAAGFNEVEQVDKACMK